MIHLFTCRSGRKEKKEKKKDGGGSLEGCRGGGMNKK